MFSISLCCLYIQYLAIGTSSSSVPARSYTNKFVKLRESSGQLCYLSDMVEGNSTEARSYTPAAGACFAGFWGV